MQFCSVVHIQWFVTIVQKRLILGCKKYPLKVNNKLNVLLLYLLDRQIPLCTNNSRSQVSFSARKYLRLCSREGLGGWRRCFKHFLEYTYFSRLVKVIIRILQPFLCFFFQYNLFIYFLTSWIFIPLLVFSLLRYSLLRYCV